MGWGSGGVAQWSYRGLELSFQNLYRVAFNYLKRQLQGI